MTFEQILLFFIMPAVGYFAGSIPFAFVIGKSKGIDLRIVGSKNIGATNLGRMLGAKYFWYAFLLDAAKGFLPVLAAAILVRWYGARPAGVYADFVQLIEPRAALPMWTPLLTAVACVVGHIFPVWLKFKGGKGVATGFGVVLGFWPLYTLAGVVAGMTFVVVLMISRYISLSSIVSSAIFVVVVGGLAIYPNQYIDTYVQNSADRWPLIGVAAFFAVIIIWRHRTNIVRLSKGTEIQVGQREIDKSKMKPENK